MSQASSAVSKLVRPVGPARPLVIDSPHSGMIWPQGYVPGCGKEALEVSRDAYVDRLFLGAVQHGASLLSAQFPRGFVDLNRAISDIDPAQLAGHWCGTAAQPQNAKSGKGVAWTTARNGQKIDQPAPLAVEIEQRLVRYYLPYHARLARILAAHHTSFGQCWHLDVHSMFRQGRSVGAKCYDQTMPRRDRPDMVVSDADSQSADPAFVEEIIRLLSGLGYQVSHNDPFWGGHIIRRYGRPEQGVHSVQIEISRDLYMDDINQIPHAGFATLARNLDSFVGDLAVWIDARRLSPRLILPQGRQKSSQDHKSAEPWR